MTTGEKILKMRKARGWSQEELAERVGVTRQAVSRWEAGTAKPDADKIIAVCDLFGVSADYLLREDCMGERSAAQGETVHMSQSGVSAKQICGIVLLVLAIVLLFALGIASTFQRYTFFSSYGTVYTGFMGYILCNELQWFLVLDAAVGILGLGMAFGSAKWKKLLDSFWERIDARLR